MKNVYILNKRLQILKYLLYVSYSSKIIKKNYIHTY